MKAFICFALLVCGAVLTVDSIVNRADDSVGVRVIRRVRGGCSGGRCG